MLLEYEADESTDSCNQGSQYGEAEKVSCRQRCQLCKHDRSFLRVVLRLTPRLRSGGSHWKNRFVAVAGSHKFGQIIQCLISQAPWGKAS